MSSRAQPVYLFADSQLLFWHNQGAVFMQSIVQSLPQRGALEAAYIGASNGDDPAFYHLFEAAMHNIGVRRCHMIGPSYSSAEHAALEQADMILLAGGDTETGWHVFQRVGLGDVLRRRYHAGGVLLGISAGAVQLGTTGWTHAAASSADLFDTFTLVPFVIGAHEECTSWDMLKKVVSWRDAGTRGIGIPTGGGMVCHPNHVIEAIRHPLHEFINDGERVSHRVLPPGTAFR